MVIIKDQITTRVAEWDELHFQLQDLNGCLIHTIVALWKVPARFITVETLQNALSLLCVPAAELDILVYLHIPISLNLTYLNYLLISIVHWRKVWQIIQCSWLISIKMKCIIPAQEETRPVWINPWSWLPLHFKSPQMDFFFERTATWCIITPLNRYTVWSS